MARVEYPYQTQLERLRTLLAEWERYMRRGDYATAERLWDGDILEVCHEVSQGFAQDDDVQPPETRPSDAGGP